MRLGKPPTQSRDIRTVTPWIARTNKPGGARTPTVGSRKQLQTVNHAPNNYRKKEQNIGNQRQR